MQETKELLSITIGAAVSGSVSSQWAPAQGRIEALAVQAKFTYGADGTSVRAWLQTSFDGGVTWMDIANFAFAGTTATRLYNLTAAAVTSIATPGDAALADNTSVNGFLGARFRVKYTTTGTYTGATTLVVTVTPK